MRAGTHRRAADDPTSDIIASLKARYAEANLTPPTHYLPPAPRRRRRGLPHLESFLIGVIAGVVPMMLVLLYLTWKGLVSW